MADITKIAASLATPSLSNALQQEADLPNGQTIDAKVAQILNDGIIRLTSAIGMFELKASHPSLQVGTQVRVTISETGAVTLSIPAPKTDGSPQTLRQVPPQSTPRPPPSNPAVITTLSAGSGQSSGSALPNIYSSSGQPVQTSTIIAPATAQKMPSSATPASDSAQDNQPVNSPVMQSVTSAAAKSAPPIQQSEPVTSPIAVSPQDTSASSVLSATLGPALAKQDSLAPLLANLGFAGKLAKPLPAPVRVAIDHVLQTLLPLAQKLSPQTLEQAIKNSGVFFENKLAQAAILPQTDGAAQPSLKLDLKGALLQLELALKPFAGKSPPSAAQSLNTQERPLPPRSFEPPQPQASRMASLSPQASVPEIATALSQQTEAALSRLRILQIASQPMIDMGSAESAPRPAQAWHIDVPLLLNGQASVIPLQIEREAEKRETEAAQRRWRVRFALDLSELGILHAMLALGGGLFNITLWAERTETYQLFKSMARDLQYALLDEELDVTDIELRSGGPRQAAPAGSYLNTQT